MSNKNLKYFMRDTTPEIVTVPGLEAFKDDTGKVIDFEIKVLPQSEIMVINDLYKERKMAKDRKGNPLVVNNSVVWEETNDSSRAVRQMIVEALVFPDLKDPELKKYYKCEDNTEMPLKVFPKAEEYSYVLKMVMKVLGLSQDDEDIEVEEAKN